jgi:hypothetical protein
MGDQARTSCHDFGMLKAGPHVIKAPLTPLLAPKPSAPKKADRCITERLRKKEPATCCMAYHHTLNSLILNLHSIKTPIMHRRRTAQRALRPCPIPKTIDLRAMFCWPLRQSFPANFVMRVPLTYHPPPCNLGCRTNNHSGNVAPLEVHGPRSVGSDRTIATIGPDNRTIFSGSENPIENFSGMVDTVLYTKSRQDARFRR